MSDAIESNWTEVAPKVGEPAIDITEGVIIKGKELIANPDNIPAARAFVAELRRRADEAETKALATTESKARTLNRNARQARRDADRIEQTIPKFSAVPVFIEEINDEPGIQEYSKKSVGKRGNAQIGTYPSVGQLLE